MRDLTPLLGIMVALGASLIFFVVWRVRYHKVEAEQREREKRAIEDGIRQGVLTKDGRPACMICSAAASEYAPVTGKSWMDKLPMLNRLFSLPPRYTIEDDIQGDICLCRSHKHVAVKKLEEFHALLRAERARFNAAQEDKVAQMDGGGLHRIVKQQYQESVRALSHHTPMPDVPKQLSAANDEPMTTIVTTGGGSMPPDEEY
jgi:hypothetical protein